MHAKPVKTSQIRKYLLDSKEFILADNLSAAQERLEYVKNMENLEQIVKSEEKHFNFKKALVAPLIALGLYAGTANAENKILIQTNNGAVNGAIRNGQVYDDNNRKVGNYINGRIYPSPDSTSSVRNNINYNANQVIQHDPYNQNGYRDDSNQDQKNIAIPSKSYNFKTAKQYIDAANKNLRNKNFSESYRLAIEGANLANQSKIKSSKKEFFDLIKIRDVSEHFQKNEK